MVVEGLSSSQFGTLYFAYGSNLSPFQMTGRCPSSGVPVAIARLNSWSWMISERGAANLVPMRPTPMSDDTDATTVWGVIYNLTPADEAALDMCEGWSDNKNSESERGPENPIVEQRPWKPFEQGKAIYNKLYLPVKIENWLIPDPIATLGISEEERTSSIVRSLIYIDEQAVIPGRITQRYVRRMGRAARECLQLGIPERWVNNNFSRHGIDKRDPNSFTDDILPGEDADPGNKSDWEVSRWHFLKNDVEQ